MAGIDRLYLTEKQYYEFKVWCIDHEEYIFKLTQEKVLDYFYDIEHQTPYCGEYMATSFPYSIDKMLYENCPYGYIHGKICEQYNWKNLHRVKNKKPKTVKRQRRR